jgi:aminoglycoside phosphotransferase (APT) family kinase protein
MRQWHAEETVDVERARMLIGAQFPELGDAPMELIGAGWDNTVMRVDDAWVFRFPRRAFAIPGVEREIEVLPRLAPNLPLPVPEPRWVGRPAHGFPWPWFGAPYIAGTELAAAGLVDEARSDLAATLGMFLRRLHAPALHSRIGPTLPTDPNRRADMAFRVEATRARVAGLAKDRIWQAPPEVNTLLSDAAGLPPSPYTTVLHGDLHARHLMVDEAGRATGVIDWGDVCVGDPAIDLAIAYAAFIGRARQALFEAYGTRVDGLTELRARVIGTFIAAALLDYAVDQDMDALRDDSVRSLERAISG